MSTSANEPLRTGDNAGLSIPSDLPGEQPEVKEPTVAELQAQLKERDANLAAEKRLNEELNKRDEFWAKRNGPPKKDVEQPRQVVSQPDPDPLDEFDIYDIVLEEKDPKKGNKRVRDTIRATAEKIAEQKIKAGGFITRDELVGMIQQVTATSELQEEFSDLKKKDSPLTQAFNAEMEAMQDNPQYAGVPVAVLSRLAAAEAERKLLKSGKIKVSNGNETEDERLERIERQGGGRGDNFSRSDDDGPLTESQKRAALKVYGVNPKAATSAEIQGAYKRYRTSLKARAGRE